MSKKNKAKVTVLALALIACMAVVGVSAYFTDGDTVTNEFTIGKVSIDLQEPNFTTEPVENITPEQEIRKDPQIKNDGINDAYVFLEVIVPCSNEQTADDEGKYVAQQKTQLFTWAVNDGWVEVESTTSEADKNTYVYAWVGAGAATGAPCAALPAGQTTGALFDYVRFANVTENTALEEEDTNIVVNAYAIQTTNLNDNDDTIDGANGDGVTSPVDVWEVIEANGVANRPNEDRTGENTATDK